MAEFETGTALQFFDGRMLQNLLRLCLAVSSAGVRSAAFVAGSSLLPAFVQ